ncbi:MAG: hypothetical protein WAU86_03515 [Oricola sp.]
MAKKPTDKAADKSNAGGTMTIVQVAGFGLGVIAFMVMVAGMADLGFVDLSHTLSVAVVPMLVLVILSVAMHAFANANIHAARFASAEAALEESSTRLEQRISSIELRINGHIGTEYEALKAENATLKAHLDEIRKAEDDKIGSEIEQLRQKNAELQDKISTWAVNSVEAVMSEDRKSAAA